LRFLTRPGNQNGEEQHATAGLNTLRGALAFSNQNQRTEMELCVGEIYFCFILKNARSVVAPKPR
jgi:hypothetical protein